MDADDVGSLRFLVGNFYLGLNRVITDGARDDMNLDAEALYAEAITSYFADKDPDFAAEMKEAAKALNGKQPGRDPKADLAWRLGEIRACFRAACRNSILTKEATPVSKWVRPKPQPKAEEVQP